MNYSTKEKLTIAAFIGFLAIGTLASLLGVAAHFASTSQTVQHAIGMQYEQKMVDVAKYLEEK